MAGQFTKAEIVNMVGMVFRMGRLSELYNQEIINYVGNTSDTNDAYMDVVSEYLLMRLDSFKAYFRHAEITRQSSYRTATHDKVWPNLSFSVPKDNDFRDEALSKCFCIESDWDDEIGKVLDYQIPLQNVTDEKSFKVDLASYNEKQNIIRLIDVSSETSENTLLHNVLKIYTAGKMINFENLQSDFKIYSNPNLVLTLLVHKDSPVLGQFQLKQLRNFINALDLPIEVFTWDYDEKKERKLLVKPYKI